MGGGLSRRLHGGHELGGSYHLVIDKDSICRRLVYCSLLHGEVDDELIKI